MSEKEANGAQIEAEEPNSNEARKERSKRFQQVLFICAPVLVLSIATVLYLSVFGGSQSLTQYRLTIAILCFTLSSLSQLLFAATNVQIRGSIGVLCFNLVGPAVTWIVALVILSWIFPEREIIAAATPRSRLTEFTQIADEVEQNEGWLTFNNWKQELGSLHELFDADEEYNTKLLLSGAFITGNGRSRIAKTEIQTLFVYPRSTTPDPNKSSKRAIKLQRIRGQRIGDDCKVYVTASSTLSNGNASSYFFIRDEADKITPHMASKQPSWHEVRTNTIDVLIVAEYEEDLGKGDWLQVHVPKYVDAGNAALGLAVASSRPIAESSVKVWHSRGAYHSRSGEIPLRFKRMNDGVSSRMEITNSWFGDWLSKLNQIRGLGSTDTDVTHFIDRVLPALTLEKDGQSRFLAPELFTSVAVTSENNVSCSSILTFLWQ